MMLSLFALLTAFYTYTDMIEKFCLGGAFLPLNLTYPSVVLNNILEGVKPPVVITEASLSGMLPGKYEVFWMVGCQVNMR